MKLENKLKRLGFRETEVSGQWYINDYYALAIYIKNNKVNAVQFNKIWFCEFNNFKDYNEYFKEVKKLLKKLSKIL